MSLYPLFADLRDRSVLVVGGGIVAMRKVNGLLRAGAKVTVSALQADEALHDLHRKGAITLIQSAFHPDMLEQIWLLVAATDDIALNRSLADYAQRQRIFINVVDDPELSSYHVPSIVDRSPLIIAISSGGTAPVFARRVRERIERLLHPSLGTLARLVASYRGAIRKARKNLRARREFYDWLMDGPVAQAVFSRQCERATNLLQGALEQPEQAGIGRVVMVGAGPGDPNLLTLGGLRALNEADVILYDRLVSSQVRELARRDAIQIDVGKRPGENHDVTQARIHHLMMSYARKGQIVVRLKGGDPFVFGRGGEELEFLRAFGIDYSIVPGITAALAGAAYAGIPLTHRDHAASVRLLTAERRSDSDDMSWEQLAQSHTTVTFYMGTRRLEQISTQLIAHGREPDTPFALVENATHPEQRTLYGPLSRLPELAKEHQFGAPSILIVGEVAALGPQLQWFGDTHAVAALAERPALAACG